MRKKEPNELKRRMLILRDIKIFKNDKTMSCTTIYNFILEWQKMTDDNIDYWFKETFSKDDKIEMDYSKKRKEKET